MDDIHVQKVASSIWKLEISKSNEGADPESVARALTGANAILRMASGVFPQTYRPLINFLSALTVHPLRTTNNYIRKLFSLPVCFAGD